MKPGMRVKLSPDGIRCLYQQKPDRANFRGVCLNVINRNSLIKGSYVTIKVKWDHIKSPGDFHESFIEESNDEKVDNSDSQPV